MVTYDDPPWLSPAQEARQRRLEEAEYEREAMRQLNNAAMWDAIRLVTIIVSAALLVFFASIGFAVVLSSISWAQESWDGLASYSTRDRRGVCKEAFDASELMAATNVVPCGVRVVVRYRDKSVVVTVADRIEAKDRLVVLSSKAAKQLGITRRGVVPVTMEIEK